MKNDIADVGDIYYRKATDTYLLVLNRDYDEKGWPHFYCFSYDNNKYVYSYMPKGLYTKVG
jgi:hypothetical protein